MEAVVALQLLHLFAIGEVLTRKIKELLIGVIKEKEVDQITSQQTEQEEFFSSISFVIFTWTTIEQVRMIQ